MQLMLKLIRYCLRKAVNVYLHKPWELWNLNLLSYRRATLRQTEWLGNVSGSNCECRQPMDIMLSPF